MVSTFIIEWDFDDIYSLIIAEEALRSKADELHDRMYLLADKEYEKENK